MSDRTIRRADTPGGPTSGRPRRSPSPDPPSGARPPSSEDTRLAVEIRGLLERGAIDEARERFAELVSRHQRRALRIAYQYLRDAADADEAVQDAFVKVFSHIGSYREAWPFEVWFTRILINGCLDRRKARARRERWFAPADEAAPATRRALDVRRHGRRWIRKRGCSRASGARGSRRRSIGSTAGSGPSSCCVTTATARRAKSAR